MDRRSFLKKSGIGIGAIAVTGLALGGIIYAETEKNMKKIVIIDGGPRRNMNTAQMLESVAQGAESAGAEVKTVRLYDMDNTYQVKNYGNYELAGFSEEAKQQWRNGHWEEDLQKAFEAGRKMAETKTF